MPAELLYDTKAYLGEGPVWDSHSQTLYWLDILSKRIFANADLLLQLDDVAGCIAARKAAPSFPVHHLLTRLP